VSSKFSKKSLHVILLHSVCWTLLTRNTFKYYRFLFVDGMKFKFFISSDGIIEVSEHEHEHEPEETEEEDKSSSSEKKDKSSKKDNVKVDDTGLVFCEGNLDVEVQRLRSALKRSEKEMRKLRYELSECHTTKKVKSENVGISTKAPKVKKQSKKPSKEIALESQNAMLKHALKSLKEELRREDNKEENQVGFLQQFMAFVFNGQK